MFEGQFRKVTHESWFSRIKGVTVGMAGVILFLIAFPVLFTNEGRAVKRYKTLEEGRAAIVEVSSERVESANVGELVHVSGKAQTDEILRDSVFGVSVNGLKLKRIAEMCQWKERAKSRTSRGFGGSSTRTTTYSYSKVFSEKVINSSDFKRPIGHENPGSMPYRSRTKVAKKATLGAFKLSPTLVAKINNLELLHVESNLPKLPGKEVRLQGGAIYIGQDPTSPQVGDVRIKFMVVRPTEVSVIAKQISNTFEPYTTKAGGQIELLQVGTHSADEMINKAKNSDNILTWGLRAAGFALIFVGLMMIFNPISIFAYVLPIFGNIVDAGTALTFLFALIISLVTIAIRWIVYRPMLSIILLVVAFALVMVIKGNLKSE